MTSARLRDGLSVVPADAGAIDEHATSGKPRRGVLSTMPDANRQIARRDARKEGEPDDEPSAGELDEEERAMKDTQRDLTSLSGPVPRAEPHGSGAGTPSKNP